jgi:hypothetical protein
LLVNWYVGISQLFSRVPFPHDFTNTSIYNTFKATNTLFNKLNTYTQTNDTYKNNGTYKLT